MNRICNYVIINLRFETQIDYADSVGNVYY